MHGEGNAWARASLLNMIVVDSPFHSGDGTGAVAEKNLLEKR